jgi:hypothetical protein
VAASAPEASDGGAFRRATAAREGEGGQLGKGWRWRRDQASAARGGKHGRARRQWGDAAVPLLLYAEACATRPEVCCCSARTSYSVYLVNVQIAVHYPF